MVRTLRLGSVYWTAVGHEDMVLLAEAEVRTAAAAAGIPVEEVPAEDLRPLPPAA